MIKKPHLKITCSWNLKKPRTYRINNLQRAFDIFDKANSSDWIEIIFDKKTLFKSLKNPDEGYFDFEKFQNILDTCLSTTPEIGKKSKPNKYSWLDFNQLAKEYQAGTSLKELAKMTNTDPQKLSRLLLEQYPNLKYRANKKLTDKQRQEIKTKYQEIKTKTGGTKKYTIGQLADQYNVSRSLIHTIVTQKYNNKPKKIATPTEKNRKKISPNTITPITPKKIKPSTRQLNISDTDTEDYISLVSH
jgi:hypothetical protein